jgi:hypothetical protein
MHTWTRPDTPAHRAAARRNYIVFGFASVIGIAVIVVTVTLLLV